jgi:cytochrome P450
MTPRKPVTDWATDWDHLDPRWREDPFPIWDELRRSCPIAHTERYQGAYLPTRYEDVRAIANDSTHFSSRRVVVREVRPEPPIPSPPITSDPPHHKPYKQLLLPPFTAEAMTRLEPKARAICNELIDKYKFEKTGLSHYSMSSGSDLPMESLSLAYEDDLITPGGIAKAGRCLQFRKRDMQSARSRKRTRVPDCMAMPE